VVCRTGAKPAPSAPARYRVATELAAHITAFPPLEIRLPWETPDGEPTTARLASDRAVPSQRHARPAAFLRLGTVAFLRLGAVWMRARASRRSRSDSGTATPASRRGPTPTCCRPANSEQGRPSTPPSREVQQRPTACPRPRSMTDPHSRWSAARGPRCRSRGGTRGRCPARSRRVRLSLLRAADQRVSLSHDPAPFASVRPGSVQLLANLLADPRARGPPPHPALSAGPHPMTRAGPMGHEELSLMPKDDVTRRRHVLLVDVTQAASDVSRLIHEARDVNLPVGPASETAATPQSAGPCSWRSCCHNPELAGCTSGPRREEPRGPLVHRQPCPILFGLPYRGKQLITPNRSSWSCVRGRR
jgi:hypothetical protein